MPGIERFGLVLALLLALLLAGPTLGQPRGPGPQRPVPAQRPDPNAQAAAQAGACACGVFTLLWILVLGFILVVWIAAVVILGVWVSRDARARNVDNPGLWVLLVVLTTWIGLIIYLVTRPQGNLYPCRSCGMKRLENSKRCPHCGNP